MAAANSTWNISPAYRNTLAAEKFSDLDAVFALDGESITQSSLCSVSRVQIEGVDYFVKRYTAPAEGLTRFIGISKAKREWQNLQHFADWHMSPAPLVAYGEESGFSRRGVVITEGVPDAVDLATLANQGSPLLKNSHWVRSVILQVAAATRAMHDHHFAHNDWKWRNILVNGPEANPKVHVIDCPAGMIWRGAFFEYRRIKDVACLDKVAKYQLSRTQRLFFYKRYMGIDKLRPRDKRDIGKILKFFKGRE